jgi:hypothetical protein
MMAARERLVATMSRMDRQVVIPASDLAEAASWWPESIEAGHQL